MLLTLDGCEVRIFDDEFRVQQLTIGSATNDQESDEAATKQQRNEHFSTWIVQLVTDTFGSFVFLLLYFLCLHRPFCGWMELRRRNNSQQYTHGRLYDSHWTPPG